MSRSAELTHQSFRARHSGAYLLTIFVFIWLVVYAVFRVWTIWFSFSIDSRVTDRVIIVIFALAELFIVVHAIGYFTNLRRAIINYVRPRPFFPSQELPPVEVVVPARNEPYDILERTLFAIKNIDYPNISIKLLDDSNEPRLIASTKQVAHDVGIDYIRRKETGRGAKAGNINDFLKISDSAVPYLIIFDADYRPTRDFLKLVVAQMELDPKIGFIQTPQFYSDLHRSSISKSAQMLQSVFYEHIAEGKSTKDAMFMCGTNVILRKQALSEIGGFVENSITEDFATTIPILKHGWKGKYFNFATAFGDGPETIEDFFKQQYRWARGTLGAFFASLADLLSPRSGLSFWQRAESALSGSYYLTGIAQMVLILLPPIYIFWRTPVYFSQPMFYFVAYMPYFTFSTIFFVYALSSRRYNIADLIRSQSLQIMALPVYIRASIDTLLNRRSTFSVTPKAIHTQTTRRISIPWKHMPVQIAVYAFNGAAIIFGTTQLIVNSFDMSLLINVMWAVFHILLMQYFVYHVYYGSQAGQ